MALAYGSFHELSHQLRFLLFEAGIGLKQTAVDHFITLAHRDCLQRLHQAAIQEKLVTSPIFSHHVHDFLDQLHSKMKHTHPGSLFFQWQNLRTELDESIANQALALAYRQSWQANLCQQAKGFSSLWSWLNQQLSNQEILNFLEQWGCTGHPNHPNFRSKHGFSRREVMQYSPEFNAKVTIHWGALRVEHAHTTQGKIQYGKLLAKQFPHEYRLWQENLRFKQLNPKQYLPIPIHPWQWRNPIQNYLGEMLDNKELVLVPHLQGTRPSMSFRTMMPINSKGCHLKLAAAIQTTSALRTVSPASVDNGPVVSLWINDLLTKHEHFQNSLYLAKDLAGMNSTHPTIPSHKRNHLAVLIRENPLQATPYNHPLIPLASLFAQSPVSGKPLLAEIIEASGLPAQQYFKAYCQTVISSQLELMLRYGIALECHQQNTLIQFSNNLPLALVVRDLGGIRICTNSRYDFLPKPRFHPDSSINTDSINELCAKFIHGNLYSNLGYWIKCLNSHYGLPISELWHTVFLIIKENLLRLAPTIQPELMNQYYQQLLHQPWQHKCLLSMRLNSMQQADIFTGRYNPLSDFHE